MVKFSEKKKMRASEQPRRAKAPGRKPTQMNKSRFRTSTTGCLQQPRSNRQVDIQCVDRFGCHLAPGTNRPRHCRGLFWLEKIERCREGFTRLIPQVLRQAVVWVRIEIRSNLVWQHAVVHGAAYMQR